jgi:hypothetical protein
VNGSRSTVGAVSPSKGSGSGPGSPSKVAKIAYCTIQSVIDQAQKAEVRDSNQYGDKQLASGLVMVYIKRWMQEDEPDDDSPSVAAPPALAIVDGAAFVSNSNEPAVNAADAAAAAPKPTTAPAECEPTASREFQAVGRCTQVASQQNEKGAGGSAASNYAKKFNSARQGLFGRYGVTKPAAAAAAAPAAASAASAIKPIDLGLDRPPRSVCGKRVTAQEDGGDDDAPTQYICKDGHVTQAQEGEVVPYAGFSGMLIVEDCNEKGFESVDGPGDRTQSLVKNAFGLHIAPPLPAERIHHGKGAPAAAAAAAPAPKAQRREWAVRVWNDVCASLVSCSANTYLQLGDGVDPDDEEAMRQLRKKMRDVEDQALGKRFKGLVKVEVRTTPTQKQYKMPGTVEITLNMPSLRY